MLELKIKVSCNSLASPLFPNSTQCDTGESATEIIHQPPPPAGAQRRWYGAEAAAGYPGSLQSSSALK